jgi:hypothetical protein
MPALMGGIVERTPLVFPPVFLIRVGAGANAIIAEHTHARPLSVSAASLPSPMSTKSRSRKDGARLPPSGEQPFAFARILRGE